MANVLDKLPALDAKTASVYPTPRHPKPKSQAERLLDRCRRDPVFVRKYITRVDLDDCQARVHDAVWLNRKGEPGGYGLARDSWVAANGVGKTYTVAAIALGFAFSFRPSKIVITSKTGRQAANQTWDELKRIYNNSEFFKDLRKNGTPFGYLQETRLKIGDGHYILHFSVAGGKSAEDIEAAFEGWHSKNVLLIIDEAKRTHPAIWKGAERFFTNVHEGAHRMISVGSAGAESAPFGQTFTGKKARRWRKHKTTAFESPRVDNERAREIIKDWGEDHPLTRSMVYAEFTKQDIDSVFDLSAIEFCTRYPRDKNNPAPPEKGHTQGGIDWARSGDCETVFAPRRLGYCYDLRSWKKQKGTWSAKAVVNLADEYKKIQLVSDEAGLGGGIQDLVEEILESTGRRVRIQGLLVGQPPLRDKRHFLNIRAEMYFELARLMNIAYKQKDKTILSLPDDPELRTQLSQIKYQYTPIGKLKIQSKEDMLKEGYESPDKVDAVAMAFYRIPLPRRRAVEVDF